MYTSRQRIGSIDSCTGCCRHGNTWTFISQWLASCYRALCSSNRSKMFLMKQQGAIVALLAVLCAADAAALSSRFAASQQLALQDSEPLCGSCTWLVKSMKCELSDIDTQDEIVRTILKEVCPKLPNEVQDICDQLAPQLIPIGVMYLQSISSKELCADAALCGTTAAPRVNSLAQQDDFNCPMCKMVLIAIKQELRNPDSETALIDQAHEVRLLALPACMSFKKLVLVHSAGCFQLHLDCGIAMTED